MGRALLAGRCTAPILAQRAAAPVLDGFHTASGTNRAASPRRPGRRERPPRCQRTPTVRRRCGAGSRGSGATGRSSRGPLRGRPTPPSAPRSTAARSRSTRRSRASRRGERPDQARELPVEVPVRDADVRRDVGDRPDRILAQHRRRHARTRVEARDVEVEAIGQARVDEVEHRLRVGSPRRARPVAGAAPAPVGQRPCRARSTTRPAIVAGPNPEAARRPDGRRHDPDRERLARRLVGRRSVVRSDQEPLLRPERHRAAVRPPSR